MPLSTTVLTSDAIQDHLIRSFREARMYQEPYPHWLLRDVFEESVVSALLELPFTPPTLAASGTREVNNDTRQYFSGHHLHRFGVMSGVAEAFQSAATAAAIERTFGAALGDTYLRLEYAMDTDGFWLEPHTDIGPKRFTMLIYLSRDEGVHSGTDVYWSKDRHCKTVPFASNTALVFVPSDRTWHGFERRRLVGVRKSVIVNYVTSEWRSRDQLSFPAAPIP